MDDVELAGVRAGLRGHIVALRRLPRLSDAIGVVRFCRRRGHDRVRHFCQVHRRAQQGGGEAHEYPSAAVAEDDDLDRFTAGARGFRLCLHACQKRSAAVFDLGRDRHRLVFRARRPYAAGIPGRDPAARLRNERPGVQ